jgi:predicted ATPase/DNA-binding SARP family transcriptional activator
LHSYDETPTAGIRIDLLGPLRMLVDGEPVDVRGHRRRAALALLALNEGRVLPSEVLIDTLWGETPPDGVRQALHSLLSRLRRHLGPRADRLERAGGGYRLELDQRELDVLQVRADAESARRAMEDDPPRAVALLEDALATWRGPALAEFADIERLAAAAAGLDELRLGLEEALLEAALHAGWGATLVERTGSAAAAHPTWEARQLLHIRALAHAGRAVDALRAANDYRRRLAEETGLEPSPALAALEARIAAGAETAPVHAPPPPEPAHPALAVRSSRPPLFRTPVLGRADELARLRDLVASEPLVCVVGPPGVGKTRVAAEVARGALDDQREQVTFVPLAAVTPTTSLADTLAGTLGVRVGAGETALAVCAARLSLGRHILVLDNCEHVLGGVRDLVAGLTAAAPDLTVLLTSRVPSGLPGECVLRLSPLDTSAPDGPATQLFLDRARRVRPDLAPGEGDLEAIAEIVRRVDGLPLAIELAAGRLSALSVTDLADRLDHALDLLSGPASVSAHQRTLRSTLDWSYQLLEEPEQRLLRYLAVFADGVDLTGLALVADRIDLCLGGTPALSALVEASLVDALLDGDARYRLLETVRAVAHDRRREHPGEVDRAADVLAAWAVETAARIDAESRTTDEPRADRRLRRELANLRAAHEAAVARGDLDTAVAISVSLDVPAAFRDLPEVWGWATRLLDVPGMEAHPRRAELLGVASEAAWLRGDLSAAEALAVEGLALDARCVRCLNGLATVNMFRGDPAHARDLWQQAADLDPMYLHTCALAATYAHHDDAEALQQNAVRWASEHGSLSDLAFAHYAGGELAETDSEAHYAVAIDLARRAGSTFVEGIAMVGLAALRGRAGHRAEAFDMYEQLVRYWQETGNWTQQWTTLRNLAVLLERTGDPATAAVIMASAAAAPEAAADQTGHAALTDDAAPVDRGEVVTRSLQAIVRQRGSSPD